jgi:hypothetical protein
MSCSSQKVSDECRGVIGRLAPVVALLLLTPASAWAQAWLPARGEGSVSLTAQYHRFTAHYAPNGEIVELGGSQSRSLTLSADYGLTDRVAVQFSVPYAQGRNGHDPSPVLGHSGIDDGHYHGGVQDMQLGVQFNAFMTPVVFTPFVDLRVPAHDYPTEGEAAIGRGLREVRAGFDVGRRLDPWLPSALANLRVSRAFVEKLNGVGTDRTNVDLTLGFFLNDRWSIHAIGEWQETSGGLNFPDDVLGSPELFHSHDRILDDDHLRGGAGATFAWNDKTDLGVSYIKTLSGSNTHVGQGFSLTITRSF